MIIGENIKKIRLERGLTQSDLAEKSGIKINQISKIERGGSDPKSSTIIKIINALESDANSIFLDTQNLATNKKLELFLKDIQDLSEKDQIILLNIIEKFKIVNKVNKIEEMKQSLNTSFLDKYMNIEAPSTNENELIKTEYELEYLLNKK